MRVLVACEFSGVVRDAFRRRGHNAWSYDKLPIFKKHLDAAGYKYEDPVPFTDGTLILKVHCWQCGGEGYSHHDCGEDTCCCLHPEDNVKCDICEGKGGWKRQPVSADAEP